jgi:hypothetical protein
MGLESNPNGTDPLKAYQYLVLEFDHGGKEAKLKLQNKRWMP